MEPDQGPEVFVKSYEATKGLSLVLGHYPSLPQSLHYPVQVPHLEAALAAAEADVALKDFV
jgi:hypothetical protein